MSLIHDFGVLTLDDFDYSSDFTISALTGQKRKLRKHVRLHDDFVHYLGDSLRWIPSYNPTRRIEQCGLNYWGVTIISKSGAESAAAVFDAWAKLLALGPTRITLTGSYAQAPEGSQEQGRYLTFSLDRDEVVLSLRTLVSACSDISESNGSEYLLHFGI